MEWSSGHYPGKLQAAIRHFETVYTAWDGDTLAGPVCAMDDGAMTAYIHYLLVRPEYQHRGIGRLMMDHLLQFVNDHGVRGTEIFVELCAVPDKAPFYEKLGMEKTDDIMMHNKIEWTGFTVT